MREGAETKPNVLVEKTEASKIQNHKTLTDWALCDYSHHESRTHKHLLAVHLRLNLFTKGLHERRTVCVTRITCTAYAINNFAAKGDMYCCVTNIYTYIFKSINSLIRYITESKISKIKILLIY